MMLVYSIALVAATIGSGAGFSPVTTPHAALLPTAMQATSYAGSPRNTATGPVPRNAALWIGYSDYPEDARAAKKTGRAMFRVQVDKKGSVNSCEIIQSSGHADLDRITCLRIAERALFEPARNAKGRAVAGTYQNSVRWQVN
jgi:periplasmic protein TonB